MQKQKRAPKLRRKVASLLTLALVLVPMMALIAYAGSDSSNFSFSFGSAAGVDYDRAYKSDVGSSSGYYAQANVNSVGFNGGSVTMCVEKDQRNAHHQHGNGNQHWHRVFLLRYGEFDVQYVRRPDCQSAPAEFLAVALVCGGRKPNS